MPFFDRSLVIAVGAPKAATFSAFEHFRAHPEVATSTMKEPNFFVEAEFNAEGMRRVETTGAYRAQFSPTPQQKVLFEASPSYLRCRQSADRIARFADAEGLAAVKIVIFLRDPVRRAFSNWLMDKRQVHQPLGFVAAVEADRARDHDTTPMLIQHEYFRSGLYAADIMRFRARFGEHNLLVRVIDTPGVAFATHLRAIEELIGVSPGPERTRAANTASKPGNRVVQAVYGNRALRRLQRRLLSDTSKEALRKLLFKADTTRLEDVATATEVARLSGYFAADRAALEADVGLSLGHWL